MSYAVFCLKKKSKAQQMAIVGSERIEPGHHDAIHRARELIRGALCRRSVRQLYHEYFFSHDPATTEIYTLSLHDALPICHSRPPLAAVRPLGDGSRLGPRSREQ